MATIKQYQKDLNKDVSEFLTELQTRFPNTRVTSGFRPNAKTKQGRESRHSKGEAIDIAPTKEVYDYLWNTKEGIALLNKYGLGVLDETTPEMLKKTGGTEKHFHIGKDSTIVPKSQQRYKELWGEEEPQYQEQHIVQTYTPEQQTTAVTNLPNSEQTVNLAEETKKIEQQTKDKEQSFLQEYQDRFTPEQPQEVVEEQIQELPQVSYTDIFNQVSQFVDSPVAQQGGKYTQNELDFLSEIAIKDNRGQWDNPGKITQISSSNITMEGVKQALRGISLETGEEKIMYPDKNYFFKNTKNVLEIPLK